MKLVVIGAGGHARVVLELLRAAGADVAGLVDPAPPAPVVLGAAVLGDDTVLPRLRTEGIGGAVVAIGANAARARIGATLRRLGFALPAVVHPAAFVSPSARITEGVVVMARAVVGTEAALEALAIVNTGAILDHDARIGAAAHLAPGSALAGNVTVGARALLGVGCAVRPGVRIGADAVVGAGAAVVADVPDGAVVGGSPARPLR